MHSCVKIQNVSSSFKSLKYSHYQVRLEIFIIISKIDLFVWDICYKEFSSQCTSVAFGPPCLFTKYGEFINSNDLITIIIVIIFFDTFQGSQIDQLYSHRLNKFWYWWSSVFINLADWSYEFNRVTSVSILIPIFSVSKSVLICSDSVRTC